VKDLWMSLHHQYELQSEKDCQEKVVQEKGHQGQATAEDDCEDELLSEEDHQE
jgi:hypothetical protein